MDDPKCSWRAEDVYTLYLQGHSLAVGYYRSIMVTDILQGGAGPMTMSETESGLRRDKGWGVCVRTGAAPERKSGMDHFYNQDSSYAVVEKVTDSTWT